MTRGDLEQELGRRFAGAVRTAVELEISVEQAQTGPASRERPADYQSNAAMGLAKRLGSRSPDVAAAIVERLDVGDMLEPPRGEGPGFVNLTLRRDWLERHVAELRCDERLGVARTDTPRRVVVDYSAANVAKEMHV